MINPFIESCQDSTSPCCDSELFPVWVDGIQYLCLHCKEVLQFLGSTNLEEALEVLRW